VFARLARFDIRFRWPIVAAWIVAVVLLPRVLPSLASQTASSAFLPASAPSQQAAVLAAPFQRATTTETALIVAVRDTGPISADDEPALARVEAAVAQLPGVAAVHDEGGSADGRARRVLVVPSGSAGPSNAGNPGLVDAIRGTFADAGAPAGLALHLTGPLAQAADAAASSSQTGNAIRLGTVLFVVVLLVLVYRSVLGPIATLLPAIAALLVAEPLIAAAAQAGLPLSPATGTLLPVLLLGAGADYGLFLVFRLREERRAGRIGDDGLVAAVSHVGESITYSGLTVMAALACLVVASFALYQGLGPSLAIGVGVLLLAGLTLLPALLAIFGRWLFWPTGVGAGQPTIGAWGTLARRVASRPWPVLLAGVVLFAVLALGIRGFRTAGFASGPSASGTDSAAGSAALAAHFPVASADAETLVFAYPEPVWSAPDRLAQAEQLLGASPDLTRVSGPLDPNGTPLTAGQLADLHTRLGPAAALPASPPAGTTVSPELYQAYRATAPFISPDGRTVEFYVQAAAGSPGSPAAIGAIPALRAAASAVAGQTGATASGVVGPDAVAADIDHSSTADLLAVAPIVLLVIGILLALLLRSLVAPVYLVATVALSYLATLGVSTLVFVGLGGAAGLNFVIPILLFIFVMALGEDYNILLMSRVREEAARAGFTDALGRAVGLTGGTITSAGVILAGTFAVLAVVGGSDQAPQLGFTIAFGVLLDTFFVRTLLVPAIAALLGRWNWWPSALSRKVTAGPGTQGELRDAEASGPQP
jgi:RND superfamily putative drug exporter